MGKNTQSDDVLSKVQELLLGKSEKTFNKKTNDLKKDLQNQIDELHQLLIDSEKSIVDSFESTIKETTNSNHLLIREKVEKLEAHHHELIYRKYDHARASVKKIKEELTELQKKQNKKIDSLKKTIHRNIEKEIHEALNEVRHDYVSKEHISQLFISIGESLSSKGSK